MGKIKVAKNVAVIVDFTIDIKIKMYATQRYLKTIGKIYFNNYFNTRFNRWLINVILILTLTNIAFGGLNTELYIYIYIWSAQASKLTSLKSYACINCG